MIEPSIIWTHSWTLDGARQAVQSKVNPIISNTQPSVSSNFQHEIEQIVKDSFFFFRKTPHVVLVLLYAERNEMVDSF